MSGKVTFGPAAQALFRLEAPTAVSAGAGSGKTTALVELCVRLLEGSALGSPCEPRELAAITFTEKAAQELEERLRGAVAARARAAREADPESPEARAWLERLHGLDAMAVGTIHGFCGRLLREHAPEAGLDPEAAVLEEDRASGWIAASAQAAVVAALDAGRPAARALAAGLGAARGGLPALVGGLLRERATRGDGGPVALAPADEEAALAARARLDAAALALLGAGAEAATAGARALVEAVGRAREALRPGDLDGALSADALARLGGLADALRGKRVLKADGPALREAREALAAAWEALEPLAAGVLAGPQQAELARLVEDAEARYAARKASARAVDFDDLLLRARDLLRADPGVRAELRGRLRALLVDEYQDVNPVQQEVFELVAGPGGGPGPVLVAVGDLKQSIYRFRGADVAVFARLIRRLDAGEGRVLHLSENHRSAPAVLDLVNEVSARAFRPPPGAPPRDDELAFGEHDRLVPTRPDALRPACEVLEDGAEGNAAERREREAEAIAARIGALVSGAAGAEIRERDGVTARRPRFGDVAILFRRLTQIAPYERALRAAGVPYRLARGGGFYQAPEVRDLGELLAAVADPSDAVAWAALLRSPACAVSDGALLLLARAGLARLPWLAPGELAAEVDRVAAGADAAPAADSGPGASPLRDAAPRAIPADEWARLLRLLAAYRTLHALRDRVPVGELCARAVEALDLDAALLAGPDGERRAVNLEKALALAARFGEDGGTPAELAAHLRAQAARPPREPEAELEAADAVALLSVHQAKGLEWPVAFVPDLGARARADLRRALLDREGRLCVALFDPAREAFVETAALASARADDRRSAAAESRRLLYVALTRARDLLVLSGEGSGAETWRGLVEAGLAERPDLARRIPMAEVTAPGPAPAQLAPADGSPAAPLAPPPLAPPAPPSPVRAAVTELAEYARCPRRHLLGRVLGIPEPRGAPGVPPGDDPGRATARGTLAHAMLAETDLGAPPLERRAQLAAAAARRGYDPASPGVRRILLEVARFAESPGGRELALAARDGRLSREVPFLLRLGPGDGAPPVYLVGALDALVQERRGGGLTVVDYKYATPRPGAAERYRLQLLAYVLAAARAHPGARVRARLQFLRGDHRTVDVTPSARELERFEQDAPRLAAEARRGAEPSPAELGRDEARCRAEGCGYVPRCFPRRHGE
ncbi:UvrD-helicase domain-containing protein [Anaeromyxobacter dehalogenans]|uniref:DNA 3'-5' helicase n=1 Tax=Anaeromyxobacter dehalogenans (strain 2CP-C) TaxID=290397 RepID=Q2IKU9_ANADE|nr:UvrD-helicase domain-containing protein [Anaeromyxobacter dehalogenans]ABC82282.1 UvrD/REP helicase [Anaeromyxobacter dehalogenans 2CP-C]